MPNLRKDLKKVKLSGFVDVTLSIKTRVSQRKMTPNIKYEPIKERSL